MEDRLTELKEQIDGFLRTHLEGLDGCPEQLRSAMEYATLSGGKRIRPILTVLCSEATGGALKETLALACAVELVHAYSLTHDDLPAMDDDDVRRGLPTVHTQFGEAMAILVGDALLTEAFSLVAGAPINADARSRASALLARSAGASGGMVAGQAIDICEHALTDVEKVHAMHRAKTGALIAAAAGLGGIAANAAPAQLETLEAYGERLGQLFQVTDDLLDWTQEGSTTSGRRRSVVGWLGPDQANALADALHEQAVSVLAEWDRRADPLRALVDRVRRRAQ